MKNEGCSAPTTDGGVVCGRPVLPGRRTCVHHVEPQPEALLFFIISVGDELGSWRLAPVGVPAITNKGTT